MNGQDYRDEQAESRQRTRMAWIPREFKGAFRTRDGAGYRRTGTGSIVRTFPKVRGKKARAADKLARRLRREHAASEEKIPA